jgi:hypothetical protein
VFLRKEEISLVPRKELRFVVLSRLLLRGTLFTKANLHLTFSLEQLAKGSKVSSKDASLQGCNVMSTGQTFSGLSSLLTA